jgi:hypothetical protein
MGDWVRIVGWSVVSGLKSQRDLTLENLALRHQLMVLQRQSGRLRLKDRDRLLWIWLRRYWPGWLATSGLKGSTTARRNEERDS